VPQSTCGGLGVVVTLVLRRNVAAGLPTRRSNSDQVSE